MRSILYLIFSIVQYKKKKLWKPTFPMILNGNSCVDLIKVPTNFEEIFITL